MNSTEGKTATPPPLPRSATRPHVSLFTGAPAREEHFFFKIDSQLSGVIYSQPRAVVVFFHCDSQARFSSVIELELINHNVE